MSADNEGWAEAPGRVDRGAGQGDADQVDHHQGHADGHAGGALNGGLVGGEEDDR